MGCRMIGWSCIEGGMDLGMEGRKDMNCIAGLEMERSSGLQSYENQEIFGFTWVSV